MELAAFIAAGIALALSFPAWADTTNGLVVSVHDGDTLTVLVGKQQVKVLKLLEALDDHDDVDSTDTNLDVTDELLAAAEAE